jgi:hypothetical protein
MKDGEAGHQSVYTLRQYGHSIVLDAAKNLFSGATPANGQRDREYYIQRAKEQKSSPF